MIDDEVRFNTKHAPTNTHKKIDAANSPRRRPGKGVARQNHREAREVGGDSARRKS